MTAFSHLSTALATLVLLSWTIQMLAFTALDVLNTNRTPIEPLASISLLTFLLCRLLVLSQPQLQNERSVAYILTTAYRHSRRHALALLLFALSWLYELLYKSVLMVFMTVLGGVLATAVYTDAFVEDGAAVPLDEELETQALAEIDQFRDKTGVDLTAVVKMIPPRALVYVVVLVWVNYATLGVYVLRLAWRSLKMVVRSPAAGSHSAVEKAGPREMK
ncbi:hypothetical protein BJX61DRAFT_302416 [Aspergillus egyptiacus]|nr:hypothetical protein BJX61DRAFT_302416 [Aspergillus egyptiacus]